MNQWVDLAHKHRRRIPLYLGRKAGQHTRRSQAVMWVPVPPCHWHPFLLLFPPLLFSPSLNGGVADRLSVLISPTAAALQAAYLDVSTEVYENDADC